ncbi:MAG: aspartate-semialdehyde dehydrogenase [Firmicutes bacterium]|nr:aspartate-semialdehyde dehydrogenase [Bacillota bacterium]MCL2256139.1 aspartate-semialdehyde dehydrogenase [Bacillota bacterium]
MKKYNVAVVGATGMVGRKMLDILLERNFPVEKIVPFASKKSAGSKIQFGKKEFEVVELSLENIKKHKCDFAFFSAGGSISKQFAPAFAMEDAIIIDNSSAWRMDSSVPLVVPEVNAHDLKWHKNLIANPNCSTTQAVVALAPLHKKYKIKRVVYSTYQAVSGAGVNGTTDLERGMRGESNLQFSRQIFANVIPQIDVFLDNGYTNEEWKMIIETKKILGDESIKVSATAVRVPVFNGHSVSCNVEFENKIDINEIRKLLEKAEGVTLMDNPEKGVFPTPLDADGKDDVYVGRIRADESRENTIELFTVADNIRKGAALNTVQIAETLIKN